MPVVSSRSTLRVSVATGVTLAAFAANSLLCRGALADGGTDPATFTALRLASGAVMLALLTLPGRRAEARTPGTWDAAACLFGYAALFSLAYLRIPAGVGAFALFGSVQLTMIAGDVREGRRPAPRQILGVALALGGLAWLVLRGGGAGDVVGVLLMAGSGLAWGLYSLRGRRRGAALAATAGNFRRAALLGVLFLGVEAALGGLRCTGNGLALAVVSGALASGLGYALWYAVLPDLGATRAAVLQLAVPVLAALGALLLLGEAATPRLLGAAALILLGILLVLAPRRRASASES